MKGNKVLKTVLITSGFYLIIIGLMLFMYFNNPDRNYLYIDSTETIEVVLPIRNIGVGEVIAPEDVKPFDLEKEVLHLIEARDIYVMSDEVIGQKAIHPIHKGQYIYKDYLITEEKWYDGTFSHPIEVSIPSTVANSVKVGNYIDINVILDKEAVPSDVHLNHDVVIPKVFVEDLKDSNGVSIAKRDGVFTPAYAIIRVNPEDLTYYIDAKRQGSIFTRIYDDISEPAAERTYTIRGQVGGGFYE